MVDVLLADDPDIEEIKEQVKRVTPIKRGRFPAHYLEDRNPVIDCNYNDEELVIDFEQLIRVLIEHRQFEAAGQTSSRMDILRTVEYAPELVNSDVITKEELKEHLDVEIADSTIHQHLRSLVDDGLVERLGERSGVYRYTGP